VLSSHTRSTWGPPAALILTVDAPSPSTGTGTALYLDGGDAALLRATVVDSAGVVCEDASVRVTFYVSHGPGRVWGTGNGDPANQEPNHSPSRVTYHGLLRAVVKVAQASAVYGTAGEEGLSLLASVNVDAGLGSRSSSIVPIATGQPMPVITVVASAPGLAPASVNISTSVADADAVLATAAGNVYTAYTSGE